MDPRLRSATNPNHERSINNICLESRDVKFYKKITVVTNYCSYKI